MKIAFNPSTVAALTTPPNNKDITFDLRGHSIFARGVEFKGTDTNTWRDIKINNVSIGSHTLDLRNGSNTTLTNTNGVVTINSTWRPVVDNLTSDSTTSSLSAKQGKVLKALIDGKSNSGHTHDDRYLKLTGNASTATKLQTARSLWGNMFDGTNNIYGRILINPTNATGSYDEGIRIKSHNNWSVVVLCGNDNTADTGTSANTWGLFNNNGNFCINRNGSAGHTGYELCNINGNWGVGTNSPVCKLHVNGAGHFTDYVNIPTLRIYGTSDNMSWNRGPGRIIFAENTSDDQALSLVYTSYDSVRSPAGIKLTGSQGNEWFEAPRIIKTGSSDSYVLLGGGGHKLESSLNVAYSNLKGITLTGGDSNNEGYRLIFEKTMGGWDINYGVWAIAFRHSGRGTLNIGFDTTNSDGSTYIYNIRFLGSTASRESTPFRAFYNSTTKVFRIYWHYYDYTSGDIAVLRGNMEPHNGTWMASLPNNVGTELAITCNMADQATNADTVDGYHANGLLTALSNSNNGISITVGGTTKSVSNISVNYASSAGNANTLDGYPANGSNVAPYGHIPTIESDGVMEVGKYIDFHNDNNGKHDFSTRLQSTDNYGNEVNLPSASGTLALTSDILNYYWANVKISTSSSTTTSPTVSNLTATSSIRMSNISLEHTDEINNITNGGIYLNYRNSGNVSLCYGGGNVGIGTTTPSYKLHVNGQIMASGFHHASHNDDSYVLLAGGGTSHIKHGSTYWSTAIQFGNYVWLMLQIGEASNGISVVPTNISNPTKDIYVMNACLGNYKNSRHGRYRVAPNGVLYYVDGVAGMQIYTTICYVVNS